MPILAIPRMRWIIRIDRFVVGVFQCFLMSFVIHTLDNLLVENTTIEKTQFLVDWKPIITILQVC